MYYFIVHAWNAGKLTDSKLSALNKTHFLTYLWWYLAMQIVAISSGERSCKENCPHGGLSNLFLKGHVAVEFSFMPFFKAALGWWHMDK